LSVGGIIIIIIISSSSSSCIKHAYELLRGVTSLHEENEQTDVLPAEAAGQAL